MWDRNLNCLKTCSERVTGTGSSSSLSPGEEVAQRVEKSRRLTLSPPVTLAWMTSIVWTHTALEFVWPTPKLLCFLFVKSQRSVILSPFYCKQLTSSSSVESSSWQLTLDSSVTRSQGQGLQRCGHSTLREHIRWWSIRGDWSPLNRRVNMIPAYSFLLRRCPPCSWSLSRPLCVSILDLRCACALKPSTMHLLTI